MIVVLAVLIGGLYAAAVYLLLRRSLAQVILGLSILTSATNLLIFTVAGLVRARPPLIGPNDTQPVEPYADPVPQSLMLTAIVIGFGVLAFALVLAYRAYDTVGSDDLDDLDTTDTLPADSETPPEQTPRPDRALEPDVVEEPVGA